MDIKQYFTDFLNTALGAMVNACIRVLIATFLFLVSFKLVNYIATKIERSSERGHIDKTLARAFAYVFKLGMKTLIAICLIGFVGVDTSGFTALVVSIGAGVGLALNGALSNLAGGILIIITRPIRVDDFIEAQGYSGTVEDIHITNTKLRTPDNKVVFVPNGPLSSGTIVNYSVKDIRRVDLTFLIGYGDDFADAKRIIEEISHMHDLILYDPAPTVRIGAHGESGIELVARVWVKRDNYWTVKYDMLETVKTEFDKHGIEIPYRQLDVHLKKD